MSRDRPPAALTLEEVDDRLERVIAASPADETELVWFEVTRSSASQRRTPTGLRPPYERTVAVRVLDRGRLGAYRTSAAAAGELENAVRHALAHSRIQPRLRGFSRLPADPSTLPSLDGLHDAEVAGLTEGSARQLLEPGVRRGETARLEWAEARVVVRNSHGTARRATVTLITLEARSGDGRAAASARRLADLPVADVFASARGRQATGRAELPRQPVPTVLSPEAVIILIDLLNRVAFSASGYRDGTSFLREHLGIQVFDQALNLRDDATAAAGLPFPFDLEGTAKVPLDLVTDGIPRSLPLDQRHAGELGLPATGHAGTGGDARAANLFLAPGDESEVGLLARAEGGIWLGWISRIECFDPLRVQFRAQVRGARRIRDGRPAEALPRLVWEDSLLRVLSSLAGIGDRPWRWSPHAEVLGGISAPPLMLGELDGLRPAAA